VKAAEDTESALRLFFVLVQERGMYQRRSRNVLSSPTPVVSAETEAAMWDLFVAIGEVWQLKENTAGYPLRLRAFMVNRVSLHPEYSGYYQVAARFIAGLIAQLGRDEAYKKIFMTEHPPGGSELEAVKKQVSDEFVDLRLALGGFLAFGALNYRGYFGGANLPDEPVPYRTSEPGP
jgi:hypothetical protein